MIASHWQEKGYAGCALRWWQHPRKNILSNVSQYGSPEKFLKEPSDVRWENTNVSTHEARI
jgi:hypothetical protein